MVMAHATTKPTAAAHDTLPPLPWPRPAPLVILIALLAASYLALTRIPAAAPLSALLIVGHQHPPPHSPAPTGGGAGVISSCAGFYAGAGPARAVSASVEEFGAVGDGVTSNTAAFRRAVAELEARARDIGGGGGGARLEVPPGRWLTGSFNLTSRFTLFLHRGAVILGSQDPEEWPLIAPLPSYGRGRERLGPRHISLIHGEGLNDVVITGNNGTIDGQGQMWWELWWNRTLNYTRGHLVELVNSTNILMSNITLRNSPFWTVHPVYSSNVVMKDLTILAPLNAPNTDGIDPDSSSEVCIEDCYIESGDDLVAIKSGWDQYGISVGKPSTNIVIQRVSGTTPTCSGVGFGSEMSGGISNVLVRDLHVWNSAQAVRLKTDIGRGGYITNITIVNVTMEKVKVPIRFSRGADDHSDDNYDRTALPRISDVLASLPLRAPPLPMASLLRLQALVPALNVPRRCCVLSPIRLAAAATAPLARRLSTSASTNSTEPPASEADLESGLYLVATPIGNLEDITLRALRVLKCANVILSEDTRHSGKLLQHYNIKTPLLSFHKFNEREREPSILRRLHEGEAIALISDAGTPGISDPGMELARLCAAEKIPVVPIPGPSAAIAALSASGLPSNEFTFVGFLPKHARSRRDRLEISAREAATQIFYVPPHGIHQFLVDAASSFGNSRSCVIAREITKLHEEFWRGTLGEANEAFATRQPKGEITVLIEGQSISVDETPSEEFLEHELRELMAKGHTLSAAVKLVTEATSAKKKDVYALALRLFGK